MKALTAADIAREVVRRGPVYRWWESKTREVMRDLKVPFTRALEKRFAVKHESAARGGGGK